MRWIFRLLSALVILIIAAVAAFFLLPADRIANLVTDQVKAQTGRTLTISGDIRPSLWPEFGVSTGDVTLSNADWSDTDTMLRADGLSIGVTLSSLFGSNIQVTKIEAISPNILLEINKSGIGNWDLLPEAETTTAAVAPGGAPGTARTFSLDHIAISDGAITYVDHRDGTRHALNAIDATAAIPNLGGRANVTLSAAMSGQQFSLDTSVANLSDFLFVGAVETTAKLTTGKTTIDFSGVAGLTPMAAAGRLNADLADQRALFALLGTSAPDVPKGLGQQIKLSGDVTYTGNRLSLFDASLALDHNQLTGALEVELAQTPKITAQLAGGALDFSQAVGGPASPATTASSAPAQTGYSKDKIDVSALQSVDADITLRANSIDLGVATLGKTHTRTVLDAGRAVTEIRELAAYNGAFTGSFVLSSRGGLSARTNLQGKSIAVQPFLTQLAGYDRLIANGDVSLNVLAVGNTMDALMRSLSGDGAFSLGKGELRGLDLAGMLRNLDPSFVGEGAKTIFDAVNATFTLQNGELRNDDLRMTAPVLTATGKGVSNIGDQNLDYRVSAKLLEGQTNGGLRVPVIIKGPWRNLKFRLDLESLAKEEFKDEIDQVKTVVEEAVIKKIEEETGVKVDDLNSVEDALKKELENRVTDGILDLLNRN